MATAVADADSSVRATARRTYWVLKRRFPMLSGSIMGSLDPSSQVCAGLRTSIFQSVVP